MGVLDGGGHQGLGLVAGEAEHHALVAGAGVAGQVVGAVHAHGDVAGLLVDGGEDGAGVAVEAGLGAVIADAPQRLAGHGRDVHIAAGGDFAHHQHHAGGGGALTGHAGHGVLGQNGVQHAVGNLVADLVGMTFGHGFGGKNTFLHGTSFLHGGNKKTRRCAVREECIPSSFDHNRRNWHLAFAGCRAS